MGKLKISHREFYEGEVLDEMPHGQGTLYFYDFNRSSPDEPVTMSGKFEKGNPVGVMIEKYQVKNRTKSNIK